MRATRAINLSWLLALRWGSIGGQLALLALARGALGIALPVTALLAVIAAEAVSNVWLTRWAAHTGDDVREVHLAAVMMADVATLTILFALAGGPMNPFSSLYLVHVALAAVILSPRWTWTLAALSVGCFGTLFLVDGAAASHRHAHDAVAGTVWLHLHGMWLGFGLAAAFIVYFIGRVKRALAERDRDLEQARETARRAERLASLATLAAGAAHELASPLSTIAVAAKELERALARDPHAAPVTDDARLIREQVERCREILARLATDAGESMGEGAEPVSIGELIREVTRAAPSGTTVLTDVAADLDRALVHAPRRAVAQAIGCLVKNAAQASPEGRPIALRAGSRDGAIVFEIEDRGSGMAAQVLSRAGEPFFTTKPPSGPGRGMGLGLFVARAVAERLGGALELESLPGRGTTARLSIRRGAATAR